MFEDLKNLLNEYFPIIASLMSIIFGLTSILLYFQEQVSLFYIIISSIIGALIITILLVIILKKNLLNRSNPDYKTFSSLDTLTIRDETGKNANYTKRLSIQFKKDINSFYIFVPRTSGKIININCSISDNKDFSNPTHTPITIQNYLDRKAIFINCPFYKKQKKYFDFTWDFVDAFVDKQDSFAVYPEPNQKSCHLKLYCPKINSANWLLYHAENLKPYNSGSVQILGSSNQNTIDFEFSPYLKKVYYKCSLSWIRK